MAEASSPPAEIMASDIFVSLLMTPCHYPRCFGGHGPLSHITFYNGLNINCVSNVFGRFLCDPRITDLYVCGHDHPFAHGTLFFNDLLAAFAEYDEAEEIRPLKSFNLRGTQPTKTVWLKRPVDYSVPPVTFGASDYLNLRFICGPEDDYVHFNRRDLAAFVYCGNTEDGPIDAYECAHRDVCIDPLVDYDTVLVENPRALFERDLCQRCETLQYEGRLTNLRRYTLHNTDFLDEGCYATPLGIPTTEFNAHFEHLI